jgi:PAS domain S-box-containing protein
MNISDHERIEQELKQRILEAAEAEERMRSALNCVVDGIICIDDHGAVTTFNPAAERIFGYAAQEVIGQNVKMLMPEPYHDQHDGYIASYLRTGQAKIIGIGREVVGRRKDGSTFPMDLAISEFRLGQGRCFTGIVREISERKRAEEALAQERYLLVTLMDNLPDNIYFKDGASRFVRINKALTSYFGLGNPAQAIGKTDFDFFTEEFARTAYADEQEIIRTGQPLVGKEEMLPWLDGRVRWVSSTKMPFRDKDGQISGTFGVSRDITHFKLTEGALRESEAQFRGTFENAAVGIAHEDLAGRFLRFNERFCTILGYAPAELVGKNLAEVTHPEDLVADLAQIDRLTRGESFSYTMEKRFIRKDGTVIWADRTVSLQLDATDKPTYLIKIIQDISQRKRAQERLRQSEAQFRGTFENAAVGIAHEDLAGRFLRFNERFCTILGYTPTELVGKNLSEVTHPEDLAADLAQFGALTRGESSSYTMEKRFIRKDGTSVWAELTVSLQFDATGKPTYFIKIIQDISERKRLEKELRQAKVVAEAANQAKDEFLANVSHEIRTPLNAILGMTELTLDTPLTVDQRHYLKTVKSASENLLDIINDLLDFSKIEAGKLELDTADFSLRAVLGETLRVLAMRAHRKGLELVNDVQPDVPDALIGDAGRLRQVLLNLVGNAIKFTEKGEVIVRVKIAADSVADGEVGLHFKVSDTGIGISLVKQATIFRAFEQEDTSTTRKYGGTGLGLTIAAQLVALMGGTITVDSELGRGSTFSFTARFGRQPHPAEPVALLPPPQLDNLPVLIVDDNATNRHILEKWLRDWQMAPTAVSHGMAAMDALWHRAANGRPYALVLLDARLADTDGLTVAAMIRERPELSTTRIILLTSGERNGDSARIRQLRIDARLLKPVQQDELLQTIYEVMSRKNGDAPMTARPTSLQETAEGPPAVTSLHILVAEDDEFSAQVLEQLLMRQDHRVRLTNNGREALALAEGGIFDLLLLDVHMPELDGLQVIHAIRQRERTGGRRLPVIALTARSRKEDRELCLAAGMDDFLTKPIRPAELLAAIDRLAAVSGLSRLVQPAAGEPIRLLDAAAVLAACGSDEEALRRMCRTFQNYLPVRLAEIGDALRDGDAPRLRDAAHKLTALLSAFSTTAGDVASSLEDQAVQGRLEEARPLVEQLELMARQLLTLTSRLSLAALRPQTGFADDPNRRTEP